MGTSLEQGFTNAGPPHWAPRVLAPGLSAHVCNFGAVFLIRIPLKTMGTSQQWKDLGGGRGPGTASLVYSDMMI